MLSAPQSHPIVLVPMFPSPCSIRLPSPCYHPHDASIFSSPHVLPSCSQSKAHTKIENIVDLEKDFHEQEMEIERLNEIIDNFSKLSIKENVADSLNQEQTDQVQAEVETVVNE